MEVFFNGKLMKDDEFLKVSESQIEPEIRLHVNPNKFYTLILYDPDAVTGTHIHLAKVNITNNDNKTGNIIIPYKGPAPPPKTGKHRYIFNLYEQDSVNLAQEINERQMELDMIEDILKIDVPIFTIKFISQNENGGRKKRKTKRKRNKKFKKSRRH